MLIGYLKVPRGDVSARHKDLLKLDSGQLLRTCLNCYGWLNFLGLNLNDRPWLVYDFNFLFFGAIFCRVMELGLLMSVRRLLHLLATDVDLVFPGLLIDGLNFHFFVHRIILALRLKDRYDFLLFA